MGGGGPIPHDKYINYYDSIGGKSGYPSFRKYYKLGYGFNYNERHGIYYYCIFGHYIHLNYDEDTSLQGTSDGLDISNPKSNADNLVIADERLDSSYDSDWNWIDHETKQASVFMHELGHDLGLKDRGKKETAMFTSDKGGGKNYWATNYLKEEWNSIILGRIG
jgi:hypothetical protein